MWTCAGEESVCAEKESTRFTGRVLAVVNIRLDTWFAITIGVTSQKPEARRRKVGVFRCLEYQPRSSGLHGVESSKLLHSASRLRSNRSWALSVKSLRGKDGGRNVKFEGGMVGF